MFSYRPPNDNFTMRSFLKISNTIKQPHDSLYIWSPILDPHRIHEEFKDYWIRFTYDELYFREKILNEIQNDLVLIGVKDHLTALHFNPYKETMPDLCQNLSYLFEDFYYKKFVLFTSLENLDRYIAYPNVFIIPWGGDITNQYLEYKKFKPNISKDLSSPYNYVSLNRGFRHHRAVLLSALYGMDLDRHGLISAMFRDKMDDIVSQSGWEFEDNKFADLIKLGSKRFLDADLSINDDVDIYGKEHNNNIANFGNSLINYYNRVFVELITETSFTEAAFNLTEKTLNTIYAKNFPIWISSSGTVEFMRLIGFDVFDDIIDHSYDSITDPAKRIARAIENNHKLLSDNDLIKNLWQDNFKRFDNNIAIAKTKLYDFYTDRVDRLQPDMVSFIDVK